VGASVCDLQYQALGFTGRTDNDAFVMHWRYTSTEFYLLYYLYSFDDRKANGRHVKTGSVRQQGRFFISVFKREKVFRYGSLPFQTDCHSFFRHWKTCPEA
jgi:hypothetical protein